MPSWKRQSWERQSWERESWERGRLARRCKAPEKPTHPNPRSALHPKPHLIGVRPLAGALGKLTTHSNPRSASPPSTISPAPLPTFLPFYVLVFTSSFFRSPISVLRVIPILLPASAGSLFAPAFRRGVPPILPFPAAGFSRAFHRFSIPLTQTVHYPISSPPHTMKSHTVSLYSHLRRNLSALDCR